MSTSRLYVLPLLILCALSVLSVLAAAVADRPVDYGGYRINEIPAEHAAPDR